MCLRERERVRVRQNVCVSMLVYISVCVCVCVGMLERLVVLLDDFATFLVFHLLLIKLLVFSANLIESLNQFLP